MFLTDLCDNSGFWKKDYELASFLCNFEVSDQTLRDINREKERVIDHGKFLEIVDFVSFQFGELTDNNNLHRSVITLLEKHKNQGFIRGSQAPMVKVRVKVKESINTEDFEIFWKSYPKRVGKKNTLAQWKKLTKEEKTAVMQDILKRAKDKKWLGGFIKDPERYLKYRQWEDEIEESLPVAVDSFIK